MIFTTEQIRWLLWQMQYETIMDPSVEFPYRIQKQTHGYGDGVRGKIQATLSVMLEASLVAADIAELSPKQRLENAG